MANRASFLLPLFWCSHPFHSSLVHFGRIFVGRFRFCGAAMERVRHSEYIVGETRHRNADALGATQTSPLELGKFAFTRKRAAPPLNLPTSTAERRDAEEDSAPRVLRGAERNVYPQQRVFNRCPRTGYIRFRARLSRSRNEGSHLNNLAAGR